MIEGVEINLTIIDLKETKEEPTPHLHMIQEVSQEKREIIVVKVEKFEKIEKVAKDIPINNRTTLAPTATLNTRSKVAMETTILALEAAFLTQLHRPRGRRITNNHRD
jgi:hypothetical protein